MVKGTRFVGNFVFLLLFDIFDFDKNGNYFWKYMRERQSLRIVKDQCIFFFYSFVTYYKIFRYCLSDITILLVWFQPSAYKWIMSYTWAETFSQIWMALSFSPKAKHNFPTLKISTSKELLINQYTKKINTPIHH